ncbi:MAG: GNAT family N-acetyltransferase [Myxococcota bacterium]
MHWKWSKLECLSPTELHAVLALRQRAFVVEQGCAYQDADVTDHEARHLLGSRDTALIAYLRATPRGEGPEAVALSRVVVAKESRGEGLGRAVVAEGMRRVREAFGEVPITLESQSHLVDFYRSLGFEVTGDEYLEDGIPHRPMRTRD